MSSAIENSLTYIFEVFKDKNNKIDLLKVRSYFEESNYGVR
jgi:hypothetical protein